MNAIDVGVLFDQGAQDYDRTRRQYIPCFDDFYGTALQLLPADRDAALRVLDLGAGTGLFAGLARPLLPNARFTLCDISENMLTQARKRFAHDANIDYLIANYVDDVLPGHYDVIMSALSIHHTPHDRMPFVFANVFNALKVGGIVINADQSLGSTPLNEDVYEQQWLASVRAKGCTEADIAVAQERKQADKTATMEQQLTWMRDAGFVNVDCWYKNYRFAVYSGERPAPRPVALTSLLPDGERLGEGAAA
jgi:tRNA (cmo5U34)-methyltransferase